MRSEALKSLHMRWACYQSTYMYEIFDTCSSIGSYLGMIRPRMQHCIYDHW